MKNLGRAAINGARYACLLTSVFTVGRVLDDLWLQQTPTQAYLSKTRRDVKDFATFVQEHPEYRDQLVQIQQTLEREYAGLKENPAISARIRSERWQMRSDAVPYGLLFLGTGLFYVLGETIPEYFDKRRRRQERMTSENLPVI